MRPPTSWPTTHFEQHPDAEIITSFPGLGMLAGARVLSEIGDDRTRFADARGLKAFAGSGRCPRCVPPRELADTSTPAVPPETGITKPNDTCSTSSSANCITACTPASSTTNIRRFHLLSSSQLDF